MQAVVLATRSRSWSPTCPFPDHPVLTDFPLQVEMTAICEIDLHPYEGRLEPGG
jgi:hypothetical protein